MPDTSPLQQATSYVHDVLGPGGQRRRFGALIHWVLLGFIALNVLAFVAESVEPYGSRYRGLFDVLLYASLGVFTLEYLLRVWACTQDSSGLYTHPVRGRIRYVLSPVMLIDLAAILPFYAGFVAGVDLRFLRLVRMLWILKITRYLPAMGTLRRVLKRERKTLAAVLVVMGIMLFIASSLMYLLEHERQPEKFASIPHAMWWGMATLTTVGYGDIAPVTGMGRTLGMVIMLLGIGTFALPAGILASAFAEERKRRDFIVTWNLVAQVPSFAALDAKAIADIACLLHPREVLAKEVVFHKGDEADCMFFIVYGELEAELQPEPVRMRKGDFFGELALIYHQPRSATVIAVSHAELLELDAKDLHLLFETKPKLRAYIMEQAERRRANTPPEAPEGNPGA